MKKTILVMLMMLPIFVYADTCDFIKDTTSGNNKTITCDAEKRKTTSFKTESDKTVLNNSICTIKCRENLVVSINPIVKVLAGMGFNYPLYVSGERKCTATYKYNDYQTKIKKLVSEYASLSGTAKKTKANEITNYILDKKACDNFKEKDSKEYNEYKLNSSVKVTLEVSNGATINEQYVYKDLQDKVYESKPIVNTVNYYDACDFQESSKTCKASNTTTSDWSITQRVYGKYTFKDVYVEKYTGEVKTTKIEGRTCNALDQYFTDYKMTTRPRSDSNGSDKGYSIKITATNLGNVIGGKLVANCYYQVDNLIYPQKDNLGNCIDENCTKYGTQGFQYRIVDLADPFPGRSAGANWYGKESLLTSTRNNITSMMRFEINLGRSSILKLREYNKTHKYDKFDLSSKTNELDFIDNNSNIVKRK